MVNHKLARWAQRSLTISAVLFLGTVALVFLAGLFLPDHFEVQRTLTIDATRERIHPHLIDLANWREWTPWEKTDATLVHEYSDPSSGLGALPLLPGHDGGAGDALPQPVGGRRGSGRWAEGGRARPGRAGSTSTGIPTAGSRLSGARPRTSFSRCRTVISCA